MSSPSDHVRTVAVFGSSSISIDTPEWREAYRCGRLLADHGFGIVTGGYGGAMEASSHGASDGGAHVVGITAPHVFPDRTGANAFVAECDPASTITDRLDRLFDRSSGAIALDGSLGTFAELVLAWNIAYVAPLSGAAPKPIVAVGGRWRNLIEAVAAAVDADSSMVRCVGSVDEAVSHLARTLS